MLSRAGSGRRTKRWIPEKSPSIADPVHRPRRDLIARGGRRLAGHAARRTPKLSIPDVMYRKKRSNALAVTRFRSLLPENPDRVAQVGKKRNCIQNP